MANKPCDYCSHKGTSRKLPNGLYACGDCYDIKNPLATPAYMLRLAKMKDKEIKDLLLPLSEENALFVARDEAKEKKLPPLHKIYGSKRLQNVYKQLLEGKRLRLGGDRVKE